jgi:cytidylate kinase
LVPVFRDVVQRESVGFRPMKAAVICISRSLGAGGEAIGQHVAQELGYRYVDEEIVSKAADKIGVPADLVADVEARRSLTRRVLEEVVSDMGGASMLTGVSPPSAERKASDDYRALIQQTIFETAEKGEVVIVAHAASVALGGRADVLRVLVTASPELRAERLTGESGLSASAAKKAIRVGDRARADYLKRFYGVKREEPTHYDLVVNTDGLGIDGGAKLVLAASDG